MSGSFAFVTEHIGGLHVLDISNPANPRRLGSYEGIGAYGSVTVSGMHAYVVSGWSGLQVIDFSNPTNPLRVGGNFTLMPTAVTIHGNKVYVAGDDGLGIFEQFRPPLHLKLSRLVPGGILDLAASGPSGSSLRLQRSTDLRDWENWQSFVLTESPTNFVDTDTGTLPRRFYRVVSP